jgi:hypothetical protein
MEPLKVSVVGVGSLRCGPHCIYSLARLETERELKIGLFDASEERLDLMDRLLRKALKWEGNTAQIRSSGDLDRALEDAEAVILCMGEVCARKMTAEPMTDKIIDPNEEEPIDSILEAGYGDHNRPTPFESLSQRTLEMIAPMNRKGTRKEVIESALEIVAEAVPPGARVLNMMRDVVAPASLNAEQIDWSPELSDTDRLMLPHQLLRWAGDDYTLRDPIAAAEDSPLSDWLDQFAS